MRHYAFNVGDYAAATVHLSDAEDLAYRRLLDTYYAREAPLPADVTACCRLARASTPESRDAVAAVLREFFELQADGWHQKRVDREIEAYQSKSQAAAASASARWSKPDANAMRTQCERNANASSAGCERNANHEPVTKNQEPVTKEPTTYAASEKKPRSPPSAAVTPSANGWQGIPDETLTLWRDAYPAVSLEAELKAALAWAHANPANRKSNWLRFLAAWLKRAQDRAPPVAKAVNGQAKADWWSSDDATMRKAAELGLSSRAGESWTDLRRRIQQAIEARH